MNSADQLIYNASSLLEEQGDVDGAMAVLLDAVALAEVASHPLQLLRARMFLGELLLQVDREEEALEQFREVILLAPQFADDPSAVDEEVAAAKEYLARLGDET